MKRLGAIGTGIALLEGINQFFDYVLSPALIALWGSLYGGAVFFVLAFVTNYVIVLWYKKTSEDWFRLEWLRLQESAQSTSMVGKIIRLILRTTRPLAYVGLCIYDPIYGFIYMRGRKSGSKFTGVDLFWFVASNIIGILVWIGFVSAGIEGFKRLFR
ncbi:MAG: hypothetical protein AAB660_00375 [Patescibacteria group bacterium]